MSTKKPSSFLKTILLLLLVLVFGGAGAYAVNYFCLELGGQCMYRPNNSTTTSNNVVHEVKEVSYVEESSLISALEKAKPSLVLIQSNTAELAATSFGSGIILTNDGLVLTAKHVVSGDKDYSLTLSNGTIYTASVVAQDELLDLTLLQIKNLNTNLPIAELGDSNLVKQGQRVFSLGYANTSSSSVRSGILSNLASSSLVLNNSDTTSLIQNALQTDYSLPNGFSGGALVNLNGQIIGLSVAESSGGLALPISDLKPLIQSYLETKAINRSFLGVKTTTITPDNANEFDSTITRGELIQEVIPNSPAALNELQAGDILLGLNDTDLTPETSLQKLLWQNLPDSEITLKLMRNNKEQIIKLNLAKLNLPLTPQTF